MATAATTTDEAPVARNDVFLTGRLSAEPTTRTLPSGDEITSWRLVIDRFGSGGRGAQVPGHRPVTVDTIDCVGHRKGIQRAAARWAPGDVIEVRGALRRRFWRGQQGAASRYEVEVLQAKRLASRQL
ncbi:MAG: single-strand DNA-binding protein [Actinomycetota bacterium]|jgi:single-strand DNA-binding protein|nr:single-strand DNA-binding protein [Actinomycetota bacterium]